MHSPVFRTATLDDVDACYAIEIESYEGMKRQQKKNSNTSSAISRRFYVWN